MNKIQITSGKQSLSQCLNVMIPVLILLHHQYIYMMNLFRLLPLRVIIP